MLRKNKWLMMIVAILTLLLVSGCSDNDSEPEVTQDTLTEEGKQSETKKKGKDDPVTQTDQKNTPQEKVPSIEKLESDVDLTKQLEAEEGIESVMVQVVDGKQKAVNVDIVISDKQKLNADEVIEKYGDVIKEKYPDRKIDIIVAREGQILKQITLE